MDIRNKDSVHSDRSMDRSQGHIPRRDLLRFAIGGGSGWPSGA